MTAPIHIGTAGWSIPAATAAAFPAEGSGLTRYAARLTATEINSSFYRPHRPATYTRWADSVPPGFRFAVKLPKAISHERRLVDCDEPVARFAGEIAGLGDKRGPVLLQLPPSLMFEADKAGAFLAMLRQAIGGPVVCEPRHPSWFAAEADALLATHRVARVAADPAPMPAAAQPGGWRGLAYVRLHGAPRIYWSPYDEAAVAAQGRLASALAAAGTEVWTIYDNTASGSAAANALDLARLIATP